MVNDETKWARGSEEYAKRTDGQQVSPSIPSATAQERYQHEDTGVRWESFNVDRIKLSSIERSRHSFRAQLPELIWNAAALEGNSFTLPEVRTLLDGVTVGGKKFADELQIIALSEAYSRLDELVSGGQFSLTKAVSDELHGLAARHEAIESGHFRGEGTATGGGAVNLSNGGSVPGIDHGSGGAALRKRFADLAQYLAQEPDCRRRALIYFASATRSQFYFDGNKRTARLMMAGVLMSCGYDVVSVPYARKLEYNNALDRLFADDNATAILRFLSTCNLTY